jgi:putative ABC transport system permease protein
VAKKFFGNKEGMGQTFSNNGKQLKVTGIIDDLPGNTHFPFTYLVNFDLIKNDLGGALREFYWINGANTYIVIPENYSIDQLQKKIPAFLKKNWGEGIAKEARLPMQPLKEIHFDQRYLHNIAMPTTSRNTYIALAVVALFIIITACINSIGH